jgi:hypothetical protein
MRRCRRSSSDKQAVSTFTSRSQSVRRPWLPITYLVARRIKGAYHGVDTRVLLQRLVQRRRRRGVLKRTPR